MHVIDFNIEKGIYTFQFLEDFSTEAHQHPALEVLLAEKGTFSIIGSDIQQQQLQFAIIDVNTPHQVISANCELMIMIIEHRSIFVRKLLADHGIALTNGYYFKEKKEEVEQFFHKLRAEILLLPHFTDYEPRIQEVIQYTHQHELDYRIMMKTLQELVNLSESRLSHLFKQEVGISLKKYLVWCKLRSTIQQHLHEKESLFASLLDSGFYDQPHFSKAFKDMLGISPSKVYKS